MSRTVIRRSAVAASALSLLLVAACGGSETSGESKEKAKPGAEQSAAPTATGSPTAADLEKVVLADADVKGYAVTKPVLGEMFTQENVKAAKDECTPLAHALSGGVAVGEPTAAVYRQAVEESTSADKPKDGSTDEIMEAAFDLTSTMVSLASYPASDAETVMKSLKEALNTCGDGFSGTAVGEELKVTKLTEVAAPKGGDEALAVNVTTEQDGEEMPTKTAVIRQGNMLAYFTSVNFAAALSGEDFEIPSKIIEAQLGKLG